MTFERLVIFQRGISRNSKNIPADQIQHALGKLDKERPVVLVDRTGNGARPIARLLRGVGFKQVVILEGGILAWQQAKMPLE